MDKLIKQLRNSNIGCKIVKQYVGVFCYADDVSLLCPSITGLKQMLLLCETYAEEYNIRFNSFKSQLIHFTDRTVKHSLSMSSTTLGENIRYFMFKYGINMSEWYGPLSVLHMKIQKYIIKETSIINKCTGIAIRDICNARDSNVYIMPDTEYISIIDILCTE